MPWGPIGPALAIAFRVFVAGALALFEATRSVMVAGGAWLALMSAAYAVRARPRARAA